jgi:hypothetical protein
VSDPDKFSSGNDILSFLERLGTEEDLPCGEILPSEIGYVLVALQIQKHFLYTRKGSEWGGLGKAYM